MQSLLNENEMLVYAVLALVTGFLGIIFDVLLFPRVCVFEIGRALNVKAWRRNSLFTVFLGPALFVLVIAVYVLSGGDIYYSSYRICMSIYFGVVIWESFRSLRHFVSRKDQAIAAILIRERQTEKVSGTLNDRMSQNQTPSNDE